LRVEQTKKREKRSYVSEPSNQWIYQSFQGEGEQEWRRREKENEKKRVSHREEAQKVVERYIFHSVRYGRSRFESG